MIKAKQVVHRIAGSDHRTSLYVTTWIGRLFRRLPSLCQTALLFIVVYGQRLVDTVNRVKWLTGLTSFVTLSIKVWHSGVVDKAWIGISALVGLAVSFALSLLR